MKKFKNITILILLFFIVFCVVGCQKEVKFSFPEYTIEFYVDEKYELKPIIENLENPILEYEIEGDCIKLEDNYLVGIKEGSAVVIVKIKDQPEVDSQTLYIKVKNVLPEQIISEDKINLLINDIKTIEFTFEPDNAVAEVTFESKDPSIATVTAEGVVKGIKEGKTTIVVKVKSEEVNVTKEIAVSVREFAMPTEIVCEDALAVAINNTSIIEYSFLPAGAKEDVSFESKDPSIATVTAEGEVKGIKEGTTIIIVKLDTEDVNLSKEITVTVRGNTAPTISYNNEYEQKALVNWGSDYNYAKGIVATDAEEGDISNKIEVVNSVDNKSYGEQVVQLQVTDSDGNTVTFERTIEVVWNYDVQFIGHGGCYYGIMNTEEAIRYAIEELKYQAVEVDLSQTKDGVFVLCHDATFGGKTVASTNWADLKDVVATSSRTAGLPFQNGEAPGDGKYSSTICTLEKFLQICKESNTTAVIELKSSNGISSSNQSRMQALMDEIEKAGMLENVIFLGSAYNCLTWTRKNGYEYIPCQYLVSSIESETTLQRCIDNNFDISTNTTYGGSNGDDWIARYKEAGIKISTYTYTQYVDYDVVQQWINKGVDYVTCDWHSMDKLTLPVSSNEPAVKYNVKFVDHDGTVLKERQVEAGKTAAAPLNPERKGYEFIGWDKPLNNIQADTVFTAQYELTKYSISYVANTTTVTESTWATKDEFVTDFYSDLFNWIKNKGTDLDGLTVSDGTYTFTRNGTTVKFASASDIKGLNVYDFEKTISNILYKPVTRNSDGTCVIYEDENYFLNSREYRIKYQGMDQWLYNCIKTSYAAYDTTYKVLSSGKIQIFFRMHQWMNGTSIAAFNNYPIKYIAKEDETINAVMPTAPLSYTINDTITLPTPTGNAKFLGWYLDAECTGDPITSISAGSTGTLILYAKWDK